MTVDEIKESVTMADVIGRYGIKVRNKMCSCPFHGQDKHPSMKVFKDGYKCFGCNANGDVFSFVMEMDGLSFKDAFISLGGTYESLSDRERNLMREKYEREKLSREHKQKQELETLKQINDRITEIRYGMDGMEPLSDEWCDSMNEVQMLLVKGGHYD